jgi:hypothetical protein
MAYSANNFRGDTQARRALAALEKDPQLLARARRRFSNSPLSYSSEQSGTTTQLESPEPPAEEQVRFYEQDLRFHQRREHKASLPSTQFEVQIGEEMRRLWKADPDSNWMENMPIGLYDETARKIVKDRWIEQGIWNKKWIEGTGIWRWKHEEPLKLESELMAAEPSSCLFFESLDQPNRKRRRTKNDNRRLMAEQRVILEHEREASRPFNQFIYQISKQRQQIQDESSGKAVVTLPPNVYTEAYETVKKSWTERGLWDQRWGMLPGIAWKHEEPFEDIYGPTPPASPVENNSHESGDTLNGFSFPSTFQVKSRTQISTIMSVDTSPNLNAERSPAVSTKNDSTTNGRSMEVPESRARRTKRSSTIRSTRRQLDTADNSKQARRSLRIAKLPPNPTTTETSRRGAARRSYRIAKAEAPKRRIKRG